MKPSRVYRVDIWYRRTIGGIVTDKDPLTILARTTYGAVRKALQMSNYDPEVWDIVKIEVSHG